MIFLLLQDWGGINKFYLNLACLGLEDVCKGDLLGGDRGDVSPSSGTFSSSSLMEGKVNEGPFISDSC